MRGVVKGNAAAADLLVHLTADKRQQLNHLFALNRKVMKATSRKAWSDWGPTPMRVRAVLF